MPGRRTLSLRFVPLHWNRDALSCSWSVPKVAIALMAAAADDDFLKRYGRNANSIWSKATNLRARFFPHISIFQNQSITFRRRVKEIYGSFIINLICWSSSSFLHLIPLSLITDTASSCIVILSGDCVKLIGFIALCTRKHHWPATHFRSSFQHTLPSSNGILCLFL